MRKTRLRRKFLKDQRGTAAIEFAFVAPLIFAVILSGFESGLMFTKVQFVEMAIEDVTREIYTGQVLNQELTREDVIQRICYKIEVVQQCNGNVTLQIERLNTYSLDNISERTCIHSGETLSNEDLPAYQTTNGGELVFLRVCITTDVVVDGLEWMTFYGTNLALRLPRTSEGKYAIFASAVFRNEPFTNQGGQQS